MSRIAILTTFQRFDPWYSLTGIVKDQCRMLTEYGNQIFLIVNERFNGDELEFTNATLLKRLPFAHLTDYQDNQPLKPEHQDVAQKTAQIMLNIIQEHNIDVVFTHDIVFTGWNKVYGEGLKLLAGKTPNTAWLHWIHSIPSRFADWWHLADYGHKHYLVYPNKTDRIRVAENYRTTVDRVKIIPHIKDLRTMIPFDPATCELIDAYPGLMQTDVVQIYPASSDRFEAKRVEEVIKIFAAIKNLGHSVCLFVANQWATTPKHYANLAYYLDLGKQYGLEPQRELIFSSLFRRSETDKPYEIGIPKHILMQLMMLSNLFVFPTREETFGLVLPETSLMSGALCVLNKSLGMMAEIGGGNTLYFDFGSYTHNHHVDNPDRYLSMIAMIIMGRMHDNDGILTRTFMRQHYNYDALYRKYYGPIISEIML